MTGTIDSAPMNFQTPERRVARAIWRFCQLGCLLLSVCPASAAEVPAPPTAVRTADHPYDRGNAIDVFVTLPPAPATAPSLPVEYRVERSGEPHGIYEKVAQVIATSKDIKKGRIKITVEKCILGEPYWFRVAAVAPGPDGKFSAFVSPETAAATIPTKEYFDGERHWVLIIMLVICGAILTYVVLAWFGVPLHVRQIAGLEAIEEAVGRATEMGRSCLYVPGIQDMNEMQTIAGLTILSRVAQRAAEYDCRIETPTSKSLVMTAARETVQSAYVAAGRPENYRPDDIYYVTDEQFAYVSHITGKMVREKPAACFYLGSFYAESLILSETGNSIGAIQIAGTAQPSQLPFFVASCDYTLIGEEFYAASAYLSNSPDQLGSLKGQDVGKLIVMILILIGVSLTTAVQVTMPNPGKEPSAFHEHMTDAADYLMETILHSRG